MFETGVRQLRMAVSMVWGRPFDPDNLGRLVRDAVSTVAEFGELGLEAREIIESPFTDAGDRREYAQRALRRTARRLAAKSPFYGERFVAAGVDPARITTETLTRIPVTTKANLIERKRDFLTAQAKPALATRTTGTTGQAAEVWMSEHELGVWAGLSALTAVLHDELRVDDVMHVHVSSRATAAVQLSAATCRLVGAACRILGVIPPDEALDALVGGPTDWAAATLMSTSPSYLAQLVVAARRRGLTPADFTLRRIDCGGEVLSSSVRRAATTTFGARVHDAFGMTEVIPVSGTTCSQLHLHHDLTMGHVEVADLSSGEPCRPGQLGEIVITPYFPYRECMPVFRYATKDVVRIPDVEDMSCELAGIPGTSQIVGKTSQLLALTPNITVTPRELVEAVESLPTDPWPGRFTADIEAGRLCVTMPESAIAGLSTNDAVDHFARRGLDVDLRLVRDDAAALLRPVRADLHERTFASAGTRGA